MLKVIDIEKIIGINTNNHNIILDTKLIYKEVVIELSVRIFWK